MNAQDIERMFPWGPAKLVPTRYGPRMLRKLESPTESDLRMFDAHRGDLEKRGVHLGESAQSAYGGIGLVWWQKVKEEVPPELIAKTEVREINNNELTQACKEVDAQGGRITALDHLKAGYKLTIIWPAEKGQA